MAAVVESYTDTGTGVYELNALINNKFMTMPKLEVLNLSYMKVLKIIGSGSLSGLRNLKEIHANNNIHLNEIQQSAFSILDDNSSSTIWPPLKILDIHSNNLSTIDSFLLGNNWNDLEVIDIRANPFNCDCVNKWIFEYLLTKIEKISPRMTDTMVCAFPSKMTGITLIDYKANHMRCMENHSEINNLSIGLLIGFFLGIPLSLGIFMIHRRGCFGLLTSRGPADYSRAFYKQTGTDDMHI